MLVASIGAWLCCGRHAIAQAPDPLITPPHVVTEIAPVLPLVPAPGADVSFDVTVNADGAVSDVTVVHSAGEAIDRAAADAIRQWKFEPAVRDGRPIASRVRIPLHFEPSPTSRETEHAVSEATFGASARAHRHPPRAASDFVISRNIIGTAPHTDAGSVLATAPGVYVAQPEGEAVGHEIFLRGFDAEHGQDIELSAAGVPINIPFAQRSFDRSQPPRYRRMPEPEFACGGEQAARSNDRCDGCDLVPSHARQCTSMCVHAH